VSKKKPLKDHIELINDNRPIPEGAADHLYTFFDNLKFDEYPNFDLTDPADAARAAKFASEMLDVLKLKMSQIKALENMLITGADESKE
jgi:hypothetical protein